MVSFEAAVMVIPSGASSHPLPARRFEGQGDRAVRVVQRDPDAGTGNDGPDVVVGIHRLGWIILPVPERADDVRPARVAALEADQHLVADLGAEPRPPPATGPGCREAGPYLIGTVAGVRRPRQPHLNPALRVGILVVGHDGRID